ncbi:MAG: flavodoxin [Proteobacteria bacterium]|nr:flavodoxin [Pseudomonadota bacterium]
MKKAIVIYGSTTGNTETAARWISYDPRAGRVETEVKNVTECSVEELDGKYDLVLLGCSTWGDEEVEPREDFEPFFEEMGQASLEGWKAGVFGRGDSSFTHFRGAVDAIEDLVAGRGGRVVVDSLKIDGDPKDSSDRIHEWAESILLALG